MAERPGPRMDRVREMLREHDERHDHDHDQDPGPLPEPPERPQGADGEEPGEG